MSTTSCLSSFESSFIEYSVVVPSSLSSFSSETRNLVAMLENSLKYYQKCVARFAVLNNVLTIPSKVRIILNV